MRDLPQDSIYTDECNIGAFTKSLRKKLTMPEHSTMTLRDDSTTTEKLIAMLSGFGFACTAFIFSVLVLLPLTGHLAERFHFPDALTITLIFFELFGLTAVAGIAGVVAAVHGFADRKGEVKIAS